jgi:hypothetical protein
MPAKFSLKDIEDLDTARKQIRQIGDEAIQRKQVSFAAKKAGRSTLRAMKTNLASVPVDRSAELTNLLGAKTIPPKYGGKENPGAWIGLKSRNRFTIKTQRGSFLSIYIIEYGTEQREQTTTGRVTGAVPAYAPLRKAMQFGIPGSEARFRDEIVNKVKRYIKKKGK